MTQKYPLLPYCTPFDPNIHCYEYDPSTEWDGNRWVWNPKDQLYTYHDRRPTANWLYKTFLAPTHYSHHVDLTSRRHKIMTHARTAARSLYDVLFSTRTVTKKKTVSRDCLASMTASGIQFRWKDMSIEYLASFRRYLLTNFGTYETAWTVCLARHMRIAASDAATALADMVKNIQHDEYQDVAELAKRALEVVTTHLVSDGFVTVESAKSFWISSLPTEIDRLRRYLREVTHYDTLENFWAKLSEAQELDRMAFYEGCKNLLTNFNPKACATEAGRRKLSDQLFLWFDAQASDGISLQEIVPASGGRIEHVDKSLLAFKIPLEFLRVVELDPKLHRVIFRANSKFVLQPEWTRLQKALDPDWKVVDGENEMVQFQCRDMFFDLWTSVTRRSDMRRKQTWIEFYDGQITEHPLVPGAFMRHGFGEQRWNSGLVYKGSWRHHLPDGMGKLWRNADDAAKPEAKPIYDGEWKCGRREGFGILRYVESSASSLLSLFPHRSGIQKVYKGQFRDDLFHGEGEIVVENHTVRQIAHAMETKGEMTLPQIDPSQILLFKGEFRSEFAASRRYVHELYGITWEDVHVGLEHMEEDHARFKTFFGKSGKAQLCGAPVQDFALDLYGHKGGDAVHMVHGATVEYADGTVYSGGMCQGLPDGEGKMT